MTRLLRWPDLQKRYGKLSGALITTLILFYLLSHVLSGERGLYVLFKEQRRLEQLHEELEIVSAKRKALQHKSELMGARSLDLDLLDEQSRRYLGSASKDELVITLPASQK